MGPLAPLGFNRDRSSRQNYRAIRRALGLCMVKNRMARQWSLSGIDRSRYERIRHLESARKSGSCST